MKIFDPNNHKEISRLKNLYSLGEKERIIDVIHKHPMYLVLLFSITTVGFIIVLIAAFVLTPVIFNGDVAAVYQTVAFAGLFMAVLIGMIFIIATFLYLQTKIIISSENLIQVLQKDLLHRKTSRLALMDIEDVTAEQHGFLATLFGYGNLIIQTAGELPNFSFTFCPRPNLIAKELIDTKENLASGDIVHE